MCGLLPGGSFLVMRMISARPGDSEFSAAAASLIRAASAVVHRGPQVAARI